MKTPRTLRPTLLQRLRALWDEGKASGSAEPFDIEQTLAAAKTRLTDANAE